LNGGKANCVTHTTEEMLTVTSSIMHCVFNCSLLPFHVMASASFRMQVVKTVPRVAIEGCTVLSILADMKYCIMDVAAAAPPWR